MGKFKLPGQTGKSRPTASQQTGGRTYAQSLGARPSTPEEKQRAVRQGILRNPSTRAYTMPDGSVLSNRAMQERASYVRYGERLSLEQRSAILAQTPDYRAGAGVKSHWVRAVMKQPWARGMSYREVERSPRMRDIWEHWQDLRNKGKGDTDARGIRRSGKFWADRRFAFLKEYGVLRYVNGEWIS